MKMMKKTTMLILALLLLLAMLPAQLITAAPPDKYTLEHNVYRQDVIFNYGEVSAELSLPPNTDTRRYQWKSTSYSDIEGMLRLTNDTPRVYGGDCSDCYPCVIIVDGKPETRCKCDQPLGPCPEKDMVIEVELDLVFDEETLSGQEFIARIFVADANKLKISSFAQHNRDAITSTITITANPEIHAVLRRDRMRVHTQYIGRFILDTGERITKPYQVSRWMPEITDDDGNIITEGYWGDPVDVREPAEAYFTIENPINEKTVTVYTYNGQPQLPEIPEFMNEINYSDELHRNRSPFKELLWETKALELRVIRIMYLEASREVNRVSGHYPFRGWREDNNVPYNYDRFFIEQNRAELEWSVKNDEFDVPLSMPNLYAQDRSMGRNHDPEKVVFASDTSYRYIEYPIRSGHYFNPAGTYTFTLTTEIYMEDRPNEGEPTQEHRSLVNALIRSFRYESNMVYINPHTRQHVGIDNNLRGEPELHRNTYRIPNSHRAYVSFTSPDDKLEQPVWTCGNELVWLRSEREYTLVGAEALHRDRDKQTDYPIQDIDAPHNTIYSGYDEEIPDDEVDPRLQAVLEGYDRSGTISSRQNYRYTEYLHRDQTMFKVTETTTVTITVNPRNFRLYTHAMMRNGNHYVRAYTTDIDLLGFVLPDNEEYQLNTLHNAAASKWLAGYVLDLIQVTVVGSLFEDAR